MSLYRVVGKHAYREHKQGEIFEASLDPAAEHRALRRGDIELLERSEPSLKPGSYRLPAGWSEHEREE